MSTIAQINAQRKAAGLPLIRFNIAYFQDQDLADLRDAYAQLYAFSDANPGDNRGYWAIARGHGYDQYLCHNDNRIFLTWHRAYVYYFEKSLTAALQFVRKDPNLYLTLPFWDWTTWNAFFYAPNGVPKSVNEPTYVSGGATKPNPLYSARSLYRVQSLHLTGQAQFTQRFPDQLRGAIPGLASAINQYMTMSDFGTFSDTFDFGAHGTVHVVTGGSNGASPLPNHYGDMSSIVSAAYDPIFWLHHGMVDKVWYDWQARHGNSTVSNHVLTTPVYGGLLGSQVLDTASQLKYIYSNQPPASAAAQGSTVHLAAVADAAVEAAKDEAGSDKKAAPATGPTSGNQTVELGTLNGNFRRAELEFHSLHPPRLSYEIRAYLNNPKADETTGKDSPTYAGNIVFFGHGLCTGGPGHCDPDLAVRDDYDLRPGHPLRYKKTDYSIDVTAALQRIVNQHPDAPVSATLVIIGVDGRQVAPGAITHNGVSLTTT